MFDNSLLRDVFPKNYIKTTILLYLSSCAVETVPMTIRVMELAGVCKKFENKTDCLFISDNLLSEKFAWFFR